MSKIIASVLWFPGTNCHKETMRALKRVGAIPQLITIQELIDGMRRLDECDLLFNPGGFSNGDDLGAGRIAANDLVKRFGGQLLQVIAKRIPIGGVCNGMQVLVETGLLGGELGKPQIAMDFNTSARFEHWSKTKITLHETKSGCVWTKGLEGFCFEVPVAHGQGRPFFPQGLGNCEVMATYGDDPSGSDQYPISPNGSHIAGLGTELIMGMMPHPERAGEAGLAIFEAGVNSVK
jgi:phosphoribosylformylglycinamidine synthase subunit PurQ / glutaminase